MHTRTYTTAGLSGTHSLWLVLKGVALYDDFPGKDFDAVPVDSSDEQLEASISNALARENEDLEVNLDMARRRAQTLGVVEVPTRLEMGLRAYVVEAPDLETLCLSTGSAMKPRLIFETRWPSQVGAPRKLLEIGVAGLLRKQLRMLLEESSELLNNVRPG